MAVWTETQQSQRTSEYPDRALTEEESPAQSPAPVPTERTAPSPALAAPKPPPAIQRPSTPAPRRGQHGWLIPSSISLDPVEARARIALPEFDALLLEKARVISGRFPLAEAEYRRLWRAEPSAHHLDIPHFE